MSCGTAPSCQHWQRTSCSGSSKVVLQCLIKSGGMPSLPWALLDTKLSVSMALLSSFTDGSESNSSMAGRHLMTSRPAGDSVLSGIQVRIVFQTSLHLLAFACDYIPTRGFEGGRLG